MVTKAKAQVHMDDRLVTNSELLALLEERETLRGGRLSLETRINRQRKP